MRVNLFSHKSSSPRRLFPEIIILDFHCPQRDVRLSGGLLAQCEGTLAGGNDGLGTASGTLFTCI